MNRENKVTKSDFRWTQDSGVTIRNILDEEQLTWNKDAFEQTWRRRWRSKS